MKTIFPKWPTIISLALVCVISHSLRAQEPAEPMRIAEPLTNTVVYSDSLGLSHFDDQRIDFGLVDYAPPAPPISVSEMTEADGLVFLSSPAGWFGDWHPAPRRQLIFCLSGTLEVEVSDGEVRRFGPGAVILLEDTSGQGHITRVVGEDRAYLVAVPILEQVTPSTDPGSSAQEVVAIMPPRSPLPPEAESADVSSFSFIVYGDTRGRRDGEDPQYEHSLIVESMLRTIASLEAGPDPVRFILQSGDAVVNGRNPAQWNVSFVGLINRLTREGGVPFFLAPGNHDITAAADLEAPGRLQGLQNYLSAVSMLIPPDGAMRRLDGYPTYAFGYANTFVLALDSNIAEDSTQFAWAADQLEGLDRERYVHVVALFHHPVYSSGPHGGSLVERPTAVLRTRWMPLFRKHGVDMVFTGHDHVFEHWIERYKDGTGQWRRIDQIVSGGGGAPLYPYQGEPDLRAYVDEAAPDSVRVTHLVRPGPKRGDNPYHYVVVHVDGPDVWLDVVGVDWGWKFRPYRSARTSLSDPDR